MAVTTIRPGVAAQMITDADAAKVDKNVARAALNAFVDVVDAACGDKKPCRDAMFKGQIPKKVTVDSTFKDAYDNLAKLMLGRAAEAFPAKKAAAPAPADASAAGAVTAAHAGGGSATGAGIIGKRDKTSPPKAAGGEGEGKSGNHVVAIIAAAIPHGRGYRAASPDSGGASAAGWESVDTGRSDVPAGIRAEGRYAWDMGEGFNLHLGGYGQVDIVTRDNNGNTDYTAIGELGAVGGPSYMFDIGKGFYIEPEFMFQVGLIDYSGRLEIGKSGNYRYERFFNPPTLAFRPGLSVGKGPVSLFTAFKWEPEFNGRSISRMNPDSGTSGEDRFSRGNDWLVGIRGRF